MHDGSTPLPAPPALDTGAPWQLLVEANADAVMVVGTDAVIRFANPAAATLFGRPREQLCGSLFAHWPAAPGTGEVDILRPDGSQVTAEMRSLPVSWEGAQAWVASLRDISERKQAEAQRLELKRQLCQAQKMEALGSLASGIVHDFNNLLLPIISLTTMVAEDPATSETNRRRLERVLAAGQRARDLSARVLAFSRMKEFRHEPLHLEDVVEEVLDLVRLTLPPTVRLQVQVAALPAKVVADPGQIAMALLNLVGNALDAMDGREGMLTVTLEAADVDAAQADRIPLPEPGGYARLTIRDTGPGMDAETLDRIFDPFFSTKSEGRGTGLGLPSVQAAVQEHGGGLTVYSRPGHGTAFDLYLPLRRKGAERSDPQPWPATD